MTLVLRPRHLTGAGGSGAATGSAGAAGAGSGARAGASAAGASAVAGAMAELVSLAHSSACSQNIRVMVDGTWTLLEPGDQKSLPRGLAHGVRAEAPSHWLLTMRRGAKGE